MTTALEKPPTWMVAELRRRTGFPVVECQRMLVSATLAEYKRISGEYGQNYQVDPTEDDPQLATHLLRAMLEADAELATADRNILGFCHVFWRTKKRILRERYGMDWRTPAELNQIVFD